MYNCKDEHLASISLSGDLILHNLASGARAAELKDPNNQVRRTLDYAQISRQLMVTTGDDGSVHMWDTTGCNPKLGSTPTSTKSDSSSSSITPPEAWGGERLSDKITQHRQSVTLPSRFATLAASSTLMSGSMFSGSKDLASLTSQTSMSYLTSSSLGLVNLRNRDISNQRGFTEIFRACSLQLLFCASFSRYKKYIRTV